MRMNQEQVETAIKVIRKYFADAAVWLFGSRVNDNRKGGDFDFYIETSLIDIALPMARARGELTDTLGMKVDLAVNNHSSDKPIFHIARESGVRLT
jgi:predicted nucleotidyltransferase